MPEESESTSDDDVEGSSAEVIPDGMIESPARVLAERMQESSRQDMKSWMEI
jgi:hypothetical protein